MYRLEANRVLILAIMNGSRDVAGQEKKPWEDAKIGKKEVKEACGSDDFGNIFFATKPIIANTLITY
jgi:hypothetical protein